MRDPADLIPATEQPLELREIPGSSPLMRSTAAEVGQSYGWRSARRTHIEWMTSIRQHPYRRYWLITHQNQEAGVAYMEPQPDADVEITSFGLLPSYIGRGLGGYALTLALQQAWRTQLPNIPTQRVWLRTCSTDHPHALSNYEKRGMRVYRQTVED